jgi:type II secretory pathway pseudopilin PulG
VNRKSAHSGISLIELMIVIGVMVILMAIAVPAVKGIIASFDSSAGARPLINAALSAARAIAIREQTYAGIRFQEDAAGNTYLTFIVHDPAVHANHFKAVVGRSPMKLPQNVGVMDQFYFTRVYNPSNNTVIESQLLPNELTDANLNNLPPNMVPVAGQSRNLYYLDSTSFSVVFNASGKLTTKLVWVRNQDSISDTPGNSGNFSSDNVFNKKDVVDTGGAIFYQDDYGGSPAAAYTQNFGIGPEWSRQSFVIVNKKDYNSAPVHLKVTNYLSKMTTENISPYTGELVMEYRETK